MSIFQGMPPVSLQGGPQKQQITLIETKVPFVLQTRKQTEKKKDREERRGHTRGREG